MLSIFKTFIEGGRLRSLLHQQITVLSLALFLLLATTDILPSSIRGSSYRPDAAIFAAFVLLWASLIVIALAPREWTPPNSNSAYNSLPMAAKMKPSNEEICSWFERYCSFGRVNPLIRKGWKHRTIGVNERADLPWHCRPEVLHSQIVSIRQRYKTTARMLIMLLWRELLYSLVFAGLFFVAELAVPLGLYNILEYLRDPQEAILYSHIWLLVMFLGEILGTIVQQQCAFISFRASIKLT